MKLNRPLIKQQARQLISGNVFKLFIIQLVVMICMTGIIYVFLAGMMGSAIKAEVALTPDTGYSEDYNDDFHNFGKDNAADDFNNFGNGDYSQYIPDADFDADFGAGYTSLMLNVFIGFWIIYILGFGVMLLMMPLTVSQAGLFVSFIRGKNFSTGEGISTVFKNTFKKNYGRKLGLVLLKGVMTYLWSLLFIIPGIIYAYSVYFASQIMCDNPDLTASQALDISQRMVKGHRIELFIMNLSFIPWMFLCAIGLGIPYIYVLPYIETTNSLYYENFRIRALQEGKITEDDFLSYEQRLAKYANMNANNGYAPNGNQSNPYNPYYSANQNNAPQQGAPVYNQPPTAPAYDAPAQEVSYEDVPNTAEEAPQAEYHETEAETVPTAEETAEPAEENPTEI